MKTRIPNYLTIFRGSAAIVLIILFFIEFKYQFEFIYILFVLAALSDYFDGYLARKWKVVSDFGIVFDPLFDKILVLSLLLLIFPLNIAPAWTIIILFLRDITTDVLKNYLLARGVKTPAIATAKIKTASQMTMIHFALLYLAWPSFLYAREFAYLFSIIAVVFSVYSGGVYTKRFIDFFRKK